MRPNNGYYGSTRPAIFTIDSETMNRIRTGNYVPKEYYANFPKRVTHNIDYEPPTTTDRPGILDYNDWGSIIGK